MAGLQQLYEKLSAEYSAFIHDLKRASPDKIIDSSYEKTFKEDLLLCVEYGDSFTEKQIGALLALDYPLDALYRNWLDTDVSYMDDLSESISSFATQEAELQNIINGEEVEEEIQHTEQNEINTPDFTAKKLKQTLEEKLREAGERVKAQDKQKNIKSHKREER